MRAILLLSGFLAVAATISRAESVIEGRVTLPKTRSAPVVAKRYEIVAKGGVLAPNPPLAVVWLEGQFPPSAQLPIRQMSQKNLAFVTPLLVVRTGTRVEFPNLDDTHHNIFSFSPIARFDLGRYTGDARPIPSRVFNKPGLVTVRCDIHEHMRGLVLVLDSPYFTISDEAGRYRLAALPSGSYKLKAWLSSKKTLEQPVQLTGGGMRVDFP
jgi:plastocyanin